MKPKIISSGEELNKKLVEGVNELSDAVCSTLGPRGKTVIIHKTNVYPIATKDGVTVAKNYVCRDKIKNVGAQIVRQASEQTANQAGDGTTTSVCIARTMINEAQRYLSADISPNELVKGIDAAVAHVVAELESRSRPLSNFSSLLRDQEPI